jgi:AcrR family transcriptional regulator
MKRLSRKERRTCLVQAAMGVFAQTGFRGARTRDVARAAGISEAMLFKHFPTKRALQKAIIEERIRQTGPLLAEPLKDPSPREVLKTLAARFITRSDQDPTFMRILYFSALEGEPLAPMFFRRRVAQNIDKLTELFRSWIREGKIRSDIDACLAAWGFIATVSQLMVSKHIFGVKRMEDEPGDLAEKLVDLYFRGVRP